MSITQQHYYPKSRPQPRKVPKSGANRDTIGTDESFMSNRRWSQSKQGHAADKDRDTADDGAPAPLEVSETPVQHALPDLPPPHTPSHEPPPPPRPLSSGSSGSDFSADQNHKHAEFNKRYANRADCPRTEEENDLSDEEHFIEETLHAASRAPSRASQASDEADDDDDDDDDEEGDEEGEEDEEDDQMGGESGALGEEDEEGDPESYKSGPIPVEIQEHAHALYKTFQEEMHGLAKECNKSPDVLFTLVGHGPAVRHRFKPNRWSAFQAWWSVHGDRSKPKDMKAADWVIEVKQEYEKYVKSKLNGKPDNDANRAEALQEVVSWYQANYERFVEKKKISGSFKGLINKTVNDFMHLSNVAYELHKLHAFGFIINLDPNESNVTYSSAFGASPAFLKFRESQKVIISKELRLFESYLAVSNDEIQGKPPVLFPTQWERKTKEGNRDYERRIFSSHLVTDIKRILYDRGVALDDCNDESVMHWVDWADHAYARKVCIVRWPTVAATPGPGFKPKSKVEGIDSIYVKAALKAREGLKTWSTYGPLDYIGIVSWSKEHLGLPDDSTELAEVPILINRAGEHVLKVKDSDAYMQKLSTTRQRKRFREALASSHGNDSDDDDDDADDSEEAEEPPTKRQRCAAPHASRSKGKGRTTSHSSKAAEPSGEPSLLSLLPPGMDPEIATQFLKQLVSSMQSTT
ncbi:hypothetical protein H0H92_001478 [Tricholoma furcatifolium]|nr:hypothetical protein H0H92_001478 [Tricholoma furcatifolium]